MILTPYFRVDNAIRWKNSEANNCWIILGRPTAWPGTPEAVPAIDPTALVIDTPICAFKANIKWVKEDAAGTYIFRDKLGTNRKFIELTTKAAVLTAMSNRIMLIADVADDDILTTGYTSYRQFGFAIDLVPVAGHESDTFLSAANVSNWGRIQTLQNRTAVNCTVNSTNRLKEIIPA